MAKSYIEKVMGENERILMMTRQHWFVLFGNILLEIVLMIVIVVGVLIAIPFYHLAVVGFVLVLVPFIGMLRDIAIWRTRDYIITNRRVIQIHGVFDKEIVDSSLEKVNDVKMSQSFWGRMFGFGDIEILTASELGVNLFHEIANPVEFKTAMLNAKEELGYSEGGGVLHPTEDIPAMIAKLDNLRKQGIVTEAEFQKKKAELLAKM